MAARKLAVPTGGFRHIAVIRLSSLGDVVLTLPVVHTLARAFPQARITYWTKEEYREVVAHDPAVHHVRALERDARRIEDLVSMSAELEETDLIVDLHGNTRARILTLRQKVPVLRARSYRWGRAALVHARWARPRVPPTALERYARALDPLGLVPAIAPRMSAGTAAENWAADWLSDWGTGTPVALLPGARHATKRWPETHWVGLVDALQATGRPLLLASLEREKRALPLLAERVEGVPRVRWVTEPLPRLAALLSRSAAAVACDSGLMHVAAARGIGVVALFGSTAPELGFAPAGDGHVVLCRHEPCQPCTLHGRSSCPKQHFRCMNELRPEQVAEAVVKVIARERPAAMMAG